MYFLFPFPPPTLGYPKKDQVGIYLYQCFGSVGSVRFWLPGSGSGSSKICRSTDPDPRGKITTKNCKKKTFFTPKPQIWTFEKREIIKFSSCLNGSSSFRIKTSEKKLNIKFENYFLLKNSVNLKDMTWIRIQILFFHCGSRIRIRIRIKIKWILSTALYDAYQNEVTFIHANSGFLFRSEHIFHLIYSFSYICHKFTCHNTFDISNTCHNGYRCPKYTYNITFVIIF